MIGFVAPPDSPVYPTSPWCFAVFQNILIAQSNWIVTNTTLILIPKRSLYLRMIQSGIFSWLCNGFSLASSAHSACRRVSSLASTDPPEDAAKTLASSHRLKSTNIVMALSAMPFRAHVCRGGSIKKRQRTPKWFWMFTPKSHATCIRSLYRRAKKQTDNDRMGPHFRQNLTQQHSIA